MFRYKLWVDSQRRASTPWPRACRSDTRSTPTLQSSNVPNGLNICDIEKMCVNKSADTQGRQPVSSSTLTAFLWTWRYATASRYMSFSALAVLQIVFVGLGDIQQWVDTPQQPNTLDFKEGYGCQRVRQYSRPPSCFKIGF